MTDRLTIRPLVAGDLADYKQMRDEMLLAHPEAFTSDAEAEKAKEPADYLHRLGLAGAIGCERELRRKVQHIGHVIGMMVRPEVRGQGIGRDLLEACIAEARRTAGLEMLTLTVTATNTPAIRLYESMGFVTYGNLRRALKIGKVYHDKLHMAYTL